MKYIILLGDGMADYPIDELGGKTPLEISQTPNLDRIAKEGTIGLIDTIPKGFAPGSDVANMSLLGYDPQKCYSGRGPLEAANMGINLGPDDIAFRCNLVTLSTDSNSTMEDYTAGHISSGEAKEIIDDINKELATDIFRFYPGVGYRHLFVWKNGNASLDTTPPHDITGMIVDNHMPKGNDAKEIVKLMQHSQKILKNHSINMKRISAGKKPANSIWLWGQGRAPNIVKLTEKYSLSGGMISAVDLLNGIAIYAGLKVIKVKGATGYIDTDYTGKAKKALEALKQLDFIFVHVEAPDEMGHEGNIEGKIKAIEDFDKKVVGIILNGINKLGAFRIMVLSDHPTPISLKTHTSDPSPFAVLSSIDIENKATGLTFGESSAKRAGIIVSPGYLLLDSFIRNWRNLIE